MTEYEGDEQRKGYCPVHHIKCDEIKNLSAEGKKKLPIWVFSFFAVGLFSIMGWYNIETAKDNRSVLVSLEKHMIDSNRVFAESSRVLKKATHVLAEVSFNQKTVMKKLELEFQDIPDYD